MSTPITPEFDADGKLTNGRFCADDCGQVVRTKVRYRPGHDAAHVGQLLATLKGDATNLGTGKIQSSDLKLAQKQLPSEALRAKLASSVARHNDRLATRKARGGETK